MSIRFLSNAEVKKHFLKLQSSELVSHIEALKQGLVKYSKNPAIVPPRTQVATPNGATGFLFMPVADNDYCGIKSLGYNPSSGLGFVGCINILSPESGALEGMVEAKELTGIRTALCTNIGLLQNIERLKDTELLKVTVFGAGLQAFWHVFVCAKLFHEKQVSINVIYRNNKLNDSLLTEWCPNVVEVNQVKSDDENVGELCSHSNVVYGTIPSTTPGILAEYFEKQVPGVGFTYVGLIGSYQPQMHECDDRLVSLFKTQDRKIIVDSKEHVLAEAGELIDSHVAKSQLVEIGTLEENSESLDVTVGSRKLVLSKLVGLAIMDIVTAKRLLEEI